MSRPILDKSGQRFGRLVVLRMLRRNGETWAACRCDCGKKKLARTGQLGLTVFSCGCLRSDSVRARRLKHGEASDHRSGKRGSAEYRTWRSMIGRCETPDMHHKRLYQDRGVTICERWRRSFAAFVADVGRRPSPNHSIDRYPDNNGNYEPGNVRWATRSEQAKNRRERPRIRGAFAPGVL